ncbi:MAG: GcrA family cell cycle regulator [Rickettsiales bacterium]|jgi:GcrA cell cycle regulator|nr:GcrA family cell cycle regulator [Rickettsiales bacterium]
MPWTDKHILKLKAFYSKGLSMSEIGSRLGMSKNQVVGKVNRLGLNTPETEKKTAKKPAKPTPASAKASAGKPKKSEPVKKKPAPAKKAPAKPASKPAKKPEPQKPQKTPAMPKKISEKIQERSVNHALALAALGYDQCRWPLGNTNSDDFKFCGKKVFVGKPYCFEHCKMSYAMTPPSPKDAKK